MDGMSPEYDMTDTPDKWKQRHSVPRGLARVYIPIDGIHSIPELGLDRAQPTQRPALRSATASGFDPNAEEVGRDRLAEDILSLIGSYEGPWIGADHYERNVFFLEGRLNRLTVSISQQVIHHRDVDRCPFEAVQKLG